MTHDRSSQLTFRRSFEPTHVAASAVRRGARELLDGCGIPTGVVADVELIIAELASNAVEQQPRTPIRLHVEVHEDSVLIIVTNQVSGDDSPRAEKRSGDAIDDELADRGWGLTIIENLSDELTIERDDQFTSVRVLRRFENGD